MPQAHPFGEVACGLGAGPPATTAACAWVDRRRACARGAAARWRRRGHARAEPPRQPVPRGDGGAPLNGRRGDATCSRGGECGCGGRIEWRPPASLRPGVGFGAGRHGASPCDRRADGASRQRASCSPPLRLFIVYLFPQAVPRVGRGGARARACHRIGRGTPDPAAEAAAPALLAC
eukprot:scaffold3326_cov116-Isochrysis_galbana.AAC.6